MKPLATGSAVARQDQIEDGLPVPRRYRSAAAIWLAITLSVLDAAIANVALPTIARDLNATPATAVWVINGYQLAITVLLLPLAALGDRIGHVRVYRLGLTLFLVGSLACALAWSLPSLIAARMLQGMGASGIMSMNPALVRATYPTALLGRGMGYNGLVIGVAAVIGPTLASAILSVGSWHWLFAINLPVGLLAIALGWGALPDAPGHGRAPDYIAAAMSAATLGLVVFGGETLARTGEAWGGGCLLAGMVIGIALYRRERWKEAPLVPLDLLRIRLFRLSLITSSVSFAAQTLAFVVLPFLFQSVLGMGVVESGLLMTPWPVAVGFTAPIAGRLADRIPAGKLGGLGLGTLAAGLALLAVLPANPEVWDIGWRMAVCGIGFGLFQSPNNRTIIQAAPRARSGAAGGMMATARLIGQTSGAVAVAIGFHRAGMQAVPKLLGGAATLAAVAAGLSLLRLREVKREVVAPAGGCAAE